MHMSMHMHMHMFMCMCMHIVVLKLWNVLGKRTAPLSSVDSAHKTPSECRARPKPEHVNSMHLMMLACRAGPGVARRDLSEFEAVGCVIPHTHAPLGTISDPDALLYGQNAHHFKSERRNFCALLSLGRKTSFAAPRPRS